MIRVVVADDHTLVRAGLCSLLARLSDIEVLADTGDGLQAEQLVRTLQPDIAILDITMPGCNGIVLTERLNADHTATRVIILSMHASEEYVLRALRAGASAYLLKDSAVTELELAIAAVMQGNTFLSPAISQAVIEKVLRQGGHDSDEPGRLTPRQREILQLIAQGHSSKQIAFLLNLSGKTVDTHRAQLMRRLDIYDIPGLVRYAMRTGLIAPEP